MFCSIFFVEQARKWNHRLVMAQRLNLPAMEREAMRDKRRANIERARRYRAQEARA